MSASPSRPPEGLLVLDGTAMLFRAFYSIRDMTSPSGAPNGGLFGATRMLHDMLARHPNHCVAVVFDISRDTFRRELDPRYKTNRKPAPPELLPQIPQFKELLDALGLKVFSAPGFEADDLMATLARHAREASLPNVLASNDKDLCQLVEDQTPTRLYDPYRSLSYNEAGVQKRMGVHPTYMIDYQALVGDKTDNVPGAAGIGPKTALALIEAFGHLEEIYEHLDELHTLPVRGAKGLAKKLESSREEAFLSKQLVTLHQDVPIEWEQEQWVASLCWEGPEGHARHVFDSFGLYYAEDRWHWLANG